MAKHLVFNPSHGSSSVLPRGESVGRGLGGQEEGRTQATASQEPASRAGPAPFDTLHSVGCVLT